MTPKKLEQNVANELIKRLTNEYEAFYFYNSAENWAQNVGFEKAAKFFAEESKSELEHAKGIEKYLTDWNVIPNLPSIEKPVLKFKSLADVIEQAYEMEYELYEAYEQTAKYMLANDLCTFALSQKYLGIQLQAVTEYSDMLNKLDGVNTDSKFEMLMLEKKLF